MALESVASDLDEFSRLALRDARRAVHPRRMVEGLMRRGLPESQAQRLTARAVEEVAGTRIRSARVHAILGALLLVAGLLFTVLSLGSGTVIVIWYGAVIAGGAQLGTALTQIRAWRWRLAQVGARPRPGYVR